VTAPGAFSDPFPAEFEARIGRRCLPVRNPYPAGIPAPMGTCPECAYDPCACTRTDEALDLVLEAEALGLYDAGIGEGWEE
jgi:hypothetical protein